MRKKHIVSIVLAAVVCLGLWWQVKAQSDAGQEMTLVERILRLESNLNSFRNSQESAQQEIRTKLDRVLATQDEILKKLEIVKIRATR